MAELAREEVEVLQQQIDEQVGHGARFWCSSLFSNSSSMCAVVCMW